MKTPTTITELCNPLAIYQEISRARNAHAKNLRAALKASLELNAAKRTFNERKLALIVTQGSALGSNDKQRDANLAGLLAEDSTKLAAAEDAKAMADGNVELSKNRIATAQDQYNAALLHVQLLQLGK